MTEAGATGRLFEQENLEKYLVNSNRMLILF